ncbi:ricin-type beta-trefoil lectin domain protein, partial [Kitasatospora cystarginea]|uniref:ricin-type beta-trefoil lectin domain protein n=1 Tax=Kitasatospora cystarginea TaxID=58350 RepID=UPI0031D4137E
MSRSTTTLAALAAAGLIALAAPAAAVAAPRAATNTMCLDVGGSRNNGDHAKIWQCQSPGFGNQDFVIDRGQIKVRDTIGTGRQMCLDVGGSRNNGDHAKIWQCQSPGFGNQDFVI